MLRDLWQPSGEPPTDRQVCWGLWLTRSDIGVDLLRAYADADAKQLRLSSRRMPPTGRTVVWIQARWDDLQVLPFTAIPIAEIRRPEFVDTIEDVFRDLHRSMPRGPSGRRSAAGMSTDLSAVMARSGTVPCRPACSGPPAECPEIGCGTRTSDERGPPCSTDLRAISVTDQPSYLEIVLAVVADAGLDLVIIDDLIAPVTAPLTAVGTAVMALATPIRAAHARSAATPVRPDPPRSAALGSGPRGQGV